MNEDEQIELDLAKPTPEQWRRAQAVLMDADCENRPAPNVMCGECRVCRLINDILWPGPWND